MKRVNSTLILVFFRFWVNWERGQRFEPMGRIPGADQAAALGEHQFSGNVITNPIFLKSKS